MSKVIAKSEMGFTQLELLIAIIIIGILAGIAAPSFMGMLNRGKIDHSINIIQGAMKEAQREAIRKSQRCSITLHSTGITSSDRCLPTGDRQLANGVELKDNGTSRNINYGIKGNITTGKTIIVYHSTENNIQGNIQCLVISSPLGIIRTGTYNESITASISGDNCLKK
jgi:prepilin-type N-terminal cleavage/methylation domain-containing protein